MRVKIEDSIWKAERQVIEVMKIAELAQLPPRIPLEKKHGRTNMKSLIEVEPLSPEYAAVRYLEYTV